MDCQACEDEIPDDSLFCPECGARQDPSRSNIGGRSFGVVSPEAVHATHAMQQQDAAGGTGAQIDASASSDVLSRIAGEMDGGAPASEVTDIGPDGQPKAQTDQIVDAIVESERLDKVDRKDQWLAMNQQTAASVLSSIRAELPEHLQGDVEESSTDFLDSDDGDSSPAPKRRSSNMPSNSLLRRMGEVAVRRVARKRGVAVESPQVATTEDDSIQVNVTYVDDGRVLDTPPDLASAFEHAITTELALKGFDIDVELALFRSKDGEMEHVWGELREEEIVEEEEDEEDLFACEACGHYPIRDSDPACPDCGAQFLDDDDYDDEPAPSGGPPRGPTRAGGPPSGPKRGPSGPPRGGGGPPSRGPSGPPSGGGPPKRGPGGPPSGGGPPSRGPGGPPSGGGPPSRGPGGPPKKGPGGGPPRKGPGGGPPKRRGPPR